MERGEGKGKSGDVRCKSTRTTGGLHVGELPSPPSWLFYHMHSGDGTEVLQSDAELS